MNTTRADWHAVSGMSDVPAGSARAVTLLGEDIALWRGEGGVVHAWRNQCPHRGMRLSFGQVRGDRLSCRYHGWQFDDAGQCKFMPAHRDMSPPASICVASYGCRESNGLIWVKLMGDDDATIDRLEGVDLFCKSIYVESALEPLTDLLTSAGLPILSRAADQPSAPNTVRMVVTTQDSQPETLVAALHPMTESRTGVHLVAQSNGVEDLDRQKRLSVGRWARCLRWFLENPDVPADGVRP